MFSFLYKKTTNRYDQENKVILCLNLLTAVLASMVTFSLYLYFFVI